MERAVAAVVVVSLGCSAAAVRGHWTLCCHFGFPFTPIIAGFLLRTKRSPFYAYTSSSINDESRENFGDFCASQVIPKHFLVARACLSKSRKV
jgi:hypothetical protein